MYFNDNDDVKAILIEDSECDFMPREFENFFGNIEGLQISASTLKVIRMSDLRPFPELQNVWFTKNHLTSLDGNLFAYNQNLRIASFQGNQIRSISSRLFVSLNSLKKVYLGDNVCIDQNATDSFYISDLVEKISDDCESAPVAGLETRDSSSLKSLLEAMEVRHNKEIAELKTYIEAALNLQHQETASLKSQLSTLKQRIASKLEVSQLSGMISELQNKTEKLQADVDQLLSDHDQQTTFEG